VRDSRQAQKRNSYRVEILKLPIVFPLELIVVGFTVSVNVGLIAGVYPTNKAARMNTVDALGSK
jgi:putative ABC transport system permease protein